MSKMKNFTEEDVTEAKEGFDIFDHGKPTVSLDEMVEFLAGIGINEKYPTVFSMISKMAEANPKGVNFKSFMENFQVMLGNVDTKAGLQKLFEALDVDESQYLDANRFATLAKEVGENISRDDIEYLIEEGYNCPNGKVDSETFIKMVLKVSNK